MTGLAVVALFNVLIDRYFQNLSCAYHINDGAESVMGEVDIPTIKFDQLEAIEYYDKFACQGFAISSPNPVRAFRRAESTLRYVKSSRFDRRRYLLITGSDVSPNEMLNHQLMRTISKVLLAKRVAEDPVCYELYTHRYLGSIDDTVFVDTLCSNNGSLPDDLFRIERRDLMGKVLRVPIFSTPPYVDLDTKKGAELPILLTFCETYNCTLDMAPEEEKWGKIEGNFAGRGAQHKTAIGKADLTLGCYYRMESRYAYFDFTDYTVRSACSFLVPEPRIMTGWTDSFRSFNATTWLCLFASCLILATIKFLANLFRQRTIERLNHYETFFDDVLYIYSLYLHQSVAISWRFFTAFVILFSIFLEVFYSCRLASIIARPTYTDVISNNQELEESDIKIIGLTEAYIYPVLNEVKYQSIVRRFVEVGETELLKHLSGDEDVAIAVDNLETGYSFDEFGISIKSENVSKFRLLPGELSYDYCVFLLTKHSALTPILNEHLSRIRESGLNHYYMNSALADIPYSKQFMSSKAKITSKLPFVKLTFNAIEGACIYWLIGIAVATIQLIIEVSIFYYDKKQPKS